MERSFEMIPRSLPGQTFWFDLEGNRFEGPIRANESGLFPGKPFEETLVERGLLPESYLPLCQVFHVQEDDPTSKYSSGLEHTVIGDEIGGGHLPSVIVELVPEISFASSITSSRRTSRRKVINKQKTRADGTFRLIGSGTNLHFLRDGEHVYRMKRGQQNRYFPYDWTAADLLLATQNNMDRGIEEADTSIRTQRVGEYMGVKVITLHHPTTDQVLTVYPAKK